MGKVQIVIEIPEEEYFDIVRSDRTVFADRASKECMLHAIRNGTPLPKGHGRLIDLNDLYDFDRRKVEYAPTIIKADTEVDADDE